MVSTEHEERQKAWTSGGAASGPFLLTLKRYHG